MSIKKVDRLLREYGVSGGIVTALATYVAFFSEKLFAVPALDPVLFEKLVLLGFGMVFLCFLYVFKYFERKRNH